MAKRATRKPKSSYPRFPKNAELVLKEEIEVDARGDEEVPLPCLVILGNRQGYRYLARYFAWMAERDTHLCDDPWWDPDDHVHFNSMGWEEHFSPELSDQVTFRFGTLNKRNRAAVFERYGISLETAKRGSFILRSKAMLAELQTGRYAVSTLIGP